MKTNIVTFIAISFLSGCVSAIPGQGTTDRGASIVAQINGDTSGDAAEVILMSPSGWTCKGRYEKKDFQNNNNMANFPLKCDDGRTGSAVNTLNVNEAKFNISFRLSDKESGAVAFSLSGAKTAANIGKKTENNDLAQRMEVSSPRKTSISVGMLPQYVTSFEGPGYAVDVFKYFCKVTISYKNTSASVKSPGVKILFTNSNQTVGESYAHLPSTLPGGESKTFGTEVCQGSPTYILISGS